MSPNLALVLLVDIIDEALQQLGAMSNGGDRVALNALEMAAFATLPDGDGQRLTSLSAVEKALQRCVLLCDKSGDRLVKQQNLSSPLQGKRYYLPTGDQGYQKGIAARLKKWWGTTLGDSNHPRVVGSNPTLILRS